MDRWFTVERIDTVLGISNKKGAADGLTRLPVTAVTTHAHWDHINGHGYFDSIAVHDEYESSWLRAASQYRWK